jgi:SAM-dependent methyltransferase
VRVEENVSTWNAASSWDGAEEQWSGPWGGPEAQWWGTILPRIHAFVPAATILELGPGHGRWTQYLKDLCDELILVDVAENCIEECRSRFAAEQHITYHVNDGMSLTAVEDRRVDFAFSFDSLVHAEADALQSYAHELARVLTPDGVAFIHHSNLGELRWWAALARSVPNRWRWNLEVRGLIVNVSAWRAESASASRLAGACDEAGLVCVAQEKIAWHYGRFLMDAISVITPRGSTWERPPRAVENPRFMDEARLVAQASSLYSAPTFSRRRVSTAQKSVPSPTSRSTSIDAEAAADRRSSSSTIEPTQLE